MVCGIKSDMPIVCCREAAGNTIQTQNPSRFTNEYYLLDTVPYEDFPVRNPRQDGHELWWLEGKPFGLPAAPQKPQFSSNYNNGNNNYHSSRPNTGTSHNSWWYSERPFTLAPPPPPPKPPKPITEHSPLQIRRPGQDRVSERSKLNPSTQASAW
jgi:hypothetical protein